jgi:type 2 lantibiotic biosynthesis protein LanM
VTSQRPFPEIFAPIVDDAVRALARDVPRVVAIAPPVWASLHEQLAAQLLHLMSQTFAERWCAFRNAHRVGLTRAAMLGDPRLLYDRFVSSVGRGWACRLWREFPVARKLARHVVRRWRANHRELFLRLAVDHREIAGAFGIAGRAARSLEVISAGLSDPHCGRRSVAVLSFGDGSRIVYKPRNVGMLLGFQEAIAWLNEHARTAPLRRLIVVDRGGYGWSEYVADASCTSVMELRHYYRRAGRLLGLCFCLNGVDFHADNLVAAGSHPILVDVETLFHPEVGRPLGEEFAAPPRTRSVISTGFLPRWTLTANGGAFDVSGLGGTTPQATGLEVQMWSRYHVDELDITHEPVTTAPMSNVPRLRGRPVAPECYVEDLIDGFRETTTVLRERTDEFVASRAFATMTRAVGRIVFRDTAVYAALLTDSLLPGCLASDKAWRAAIRRLPDAAASRAEQAIVHSERAQLGRLDVPFLAFRPLGLDVRGGDGVTMKEVLREPPAQTVERRLRASTETEFELQAELAAAAMFCRGEITAAGATPSAARRWGSSRARTTRNRSLLIPAAVRVGRALCARAIDDGSGDLIWVGIVTKEAHGVKQVERISYRLFDGLAGVAFALAALYHATQDGGIHRGARGALAGVKRWATRVISTAGPTTVPVGAATGAFSIAYALVRAGVWLDDNEAVAFGYELARIGVERGSLADWDVVAGVAGAALVLTALDRERVPGSTSFLRRCGDALLDRQLAVSADAAAWSDVSGRQLAGFSHGASGGGAALAHIAAATGDRRFLVAAERAFTYERSLYCESTCNRSGVALPD